MFWISGGSVKAERTTPEHESSQISVEKLIDTATGTNSYEESGLQPKAALGSWENTRPSIRVSKVEYSISPR